MCLVATLSHHGKAGMDCSLANQQPATPEILAIRERAGAPLKPRRKGLRPASAAGGSKTTRTATSKSSTLRPPLGGDSIRVARSRNDDDGEDTHAALCCT